MKCKVSFEFPASSAHPDANIASRNKTNYHRRLISPKKNKKQKQNGRSPKVLYVTAPKRRLYSNFDADTGQAEVIRISYSNARLPGARRYLKLQSHSRHCETNGRRALRKTWRRFCRASKMSEVNVQHSRRSSRAEGAATPMLCRDDGSVGRD